MKKDDHRFLWPQNALGRPERMRRVPRTAHGASTLVSRTIGDGVGVGDDVAEAVAVEITDTMVRVDSTVVGASKTEPELVTDVVSVETGIRVTIVVVIFCAQTSWSTVKRTARYPASTR